MAVGDKLVTLDGLKAVYQELNGNTNDLKNDFGNLKVDTPVTVTWQQGTINSVGTLSEPDNRIRSLKHNFKYGIKIIVPEGMQVSTRIYSASGTYENWTNWADGTVEIRLTEEKGYRFVARYYGDGTTDSAILPSAGAGISIYEIDNTDATLATSGKAADAKATGDMFATVNGSINENAGNIQNLADKMSRSVTCTPLFTQGTITTNTGEDSSTQALDRIRSDYIIYQKPFVITMSEGLRYSYRTYDRNGVFGTSSNWIDASGELDLDDDVAFVRFVLSYGQGNISPDGNFTFEINTVRERFSQSVTPKSAMIGNVSVKAAKTINFSDGTPPAVDWYLLQTPTNQFYRSKDMVTKEYLFDFNMPNGVGDWSAGITPSNDIIFVADAAGLADTNGRLSDANRINPVCFLASENYETMHTIDFGSSLKPCGWLGNVGYCVLPNGNIIFAEYTRGTVKTANVWKVSGDITNPANWVSTWSTNIIDTTDTSTAGIKHCHEVQYDFYTGIVYFGTGDSPQGSYNYYSTDNGANWTLLYGPDMDRCRRLNYVFTPDKVYWASDSYQSEVHHFWIAERDSNGIVDVENATSVSLDSTNYQACYGCVYLQSINAVVMMDRIDGNGGTSFNWYCYDIENEAVKLIGTWGSVNDTPALLGFRCEYVDWYPVGNGILTGFNPKPGASTPDTNKNALCGNLSGNAGNGSTRINNLMMYVYRSGTDFSYRASTMWV